MSIDDRLRRGLEANAMSFRPEGEARLDLVHRRRRRHAVLTGAAAVVLLMVSGATLGWLLSGEGTPGGRGTDPVDAPTATLASPPHSVIPPSNWRKVVTREELVAAGANTAFLREHLGSADRLPVLLALSRDVFSQSGRYADGWSGGDAGRLSYDDEGRLVLTSSSSGCPGCVLVLDWRLEPGELHLGDATGTLDPIDRVMYVGTWQSADE